MSLEQASLLAQIISAIAVFASLIFVGVQLQQNTKAVRAASSQAHSATYLGLTTPIVSDTEFSRIWREGMASIDSLSGSEVVRFFAFASGLFRFFESSRVQWLRGQLDNEHWHTIEQQAISFSVQPGIKSFWRMRRHWHCQEFRNWFEMLPESEARPIYYERVSATSP
jgi:hypothetical protein